VKICPVPWTETNSKLAKETTEFGVPEGDGVTLVRGLGGTKATGVAQAGQQSREAHNQRCSEFHSDTCLPGLGAPRSVNDARMEGYGDLEDRSIAKRSQSAGVLEWVGGQKRKYGDSGLRPE